MLRLVVRSGPFRAVQLAVITSFGLAACGDAGGGAELDVGVEDIDQESSITATAEEREDFRPPADSVLTGRHVDAYLRTVLLQFDLLRQEGGNLRTTVETMEQRQEAGGAIAQLRNLIDATGTLAGSLDLVGGSYVRSARSLGFNPAEMEWVQERMAEISAHLMMSPMQAQSQQAAVEMRAEVDRIRAENTGANASPEMEAYAQQLLEMAEQMAASDQFAPSRSVSRNLEILRDVRPAVTDEMWAAIGFAGGTSGLLTISALANSDDPEFQARMDEMRQLYQSALDNRASAVPTF